MAAEFLSLPDVIIPWIRPLGLALLHALWQGLAIGAVAAIALRALRQASAQARYATACAALAACVAWPALTLWRFAATMPSFTTPLPTGAHPGAQATLRLDSIATGGTLDAVLPWLVALWASGALLVLLRTAAGLHWVKGLRGRAHVIAEGDWARRMRVLSQRFGLGDVPLAVFDGDGGPLSAGLWRPMVFVPASLLAKMPPELLEALLAHELAHIRRHDYLANLLQRAAEALLFFHPVVWWLSRRIRQERELVADDLAASVLGEPKRLALALAELDQTLSLPNLAQAAHGGQLMTRIRSLLHPRRPSTTSVLPLGILAAACIGCLAYAQSTRAPEGHVAAQAAGTSTALAASQANDAAVDAAGSPPHTSRIATDGTIALVDANRDGIRMSGHSDDIADIRAAKRQVSGDFLWLRRDGKSMVVRDPATVARVREIWDRHGPAEARMESLQAEMERHSGKLEAIGKRMEAATPDGGETPAMREATAKMSALADQQDMLAREQASIATRAATRAEDGARTAKEEARMAEIDRRMAMIDREMADSERTLATELERLERSFEPMKALELEMEAASKPMEALGKEMEALSREYERQTLETDRRVRAEFDRALAAGLAETVKQ